MEMVLPADKTPRAVVIGPASSELRRAIGPTSWAILEEMALRSTDVGEFRVARVSVRALASSLGLAKDTAARAIRRLRDAGLVTAVQERKQSGIFDVSTYRLSVPSEVITVFAQDAVMNPHPAEPRRSSAASRLKLGQLALALED
jgi:DNA-binding transcriptional ArsR family regulator